MIRKPLVLVNGELQQLQAGDYTKSYDAARQTNNEVGSLAICTPVYNDGDGTIKKARANALATKDVIGLVFNGTIAPGAIGDVLLSGVHTASTAAWDAAFGTSGGLTEGVRYFLSDTVAGEASDQAPTADGAFVVELGQAMSPTDLRLSAPYRSIKL